MHIFKINIYFIFLLLFLVGCEKNSDPSLATASIKIKAITTESSIVNGRTEETGLEFTKILLGVTEIELETAEENQEEDDNLFEDSDEDNDGENDDEEIEFEGNFSVDLIAGTSTPEFSIVQITPDIYEEIEIELGPILEGDKSIIIEFNYVPEGSTLPVFVSYTYEKELEIEIESENGYNLEVGDINNLLILFNLDMVFSNINLSNAEVVNGVIKINSDSNINIYDTIENALKDMFEGGKDEDEDDEIDD